MDNEEQLTDSGCQEDQLIKKLIPREMTIKTQTDSDNFKTILKHSTTETAIHFNIGYWTLDQDEISSTVEYKVFRKN